MTEAECKVETIKHIERVRYYLRIITDKLTTRGVTHDKLNWRALRQNCLPSLLLGLLS